MIGIQFLNDFCVHTRRLIKHAWCRSPILLIAIIIIVLVSSLTPYAVAWSTGKLVDALINHDPNTLRWAYIVVGIAALIAYLSPIKQAVSVAFRPRLHHLFTSLASMAIARMDVASHDDPRNQDMITKVVEQAPQRVPQFVERLFLLVQNLIELITASVIFMAASPYLALLLLVSMLPKSWAELSYGLSVWQLEGRLAESRRKYWWSRWALINPESLPATKIHRAEKYFAVVMDECATYSIGETDRNERRNFFRQILALLLPQLGIALVTIYLVEQTMEGHLAVGRLTFYLGSLAGLLQSVSSLSINLGWQFQDFLFVRDMQNLCNQRTTMSRPDNPVPIKIATTPRIQFADATLGYPGRPPVLTHVNLTIEPGMAIGIVGPNAAGKTTLIKFLLGFYHVTEGKLLIDGINIRDIDIENDWWPRIGVLFQHFVISGHLTARQAIALARLSPEERIDDSRVARAASQSGADAFIKRWSKGYDTPLARWFSGGESLSGGEQQKIAIASALYREPQVLILDEPTSNIDGRSEEEIFNRIIHAANGRTSLLISHRYHTLIEADWIIVVTDGGISEQGTHYELMKRGGEYAKEFERQALLYLKGMSNLDNV